MKIEDIAKYAANVFKCKACVVRVKASTVTIVLESTVIASKKIDKLLRQCGCCKNYRVRIFDGRLAIELHHNPSVRLEGVQGEACIAPETGEQNMLHETRGSLTAPGKEVCSADFRKETVYQEETDEEFLKRKQDELDEWVP